MAEFSLAFRSIVSGADLATLDNRVTVTGDGLDSRNIAVTAGHDRLVDIAFDLADVKGYYIVADGDLKLETNTSVGTGTAGETINLTEDSPIVWYEGCGYAMHFADDVTAMYFTNLGQSTVNVKIRVLLDATP